jgi:hypothetical protein
MAEPVKPDEKKADQLIYDFRNAKFKQDSNSTVKKSIVLSLKEEKTPVQRKELISQRVPDLKVTANLFAGKVRAMESITATSSTAKNKLLEMRYKRTDKKYITTDEFNSILDNKSYAIVFVDKFKQKIYIIDPEKISTGLDEIKVTVSNHEITDQRETIPPTSKKIADLQQFLGIKINGIFDAETFDTVVEFYCKGLLKGNYRGIMMLEKLMIALTHRMGTEVNAGAYVKGLLVVKMALATAQTGKTGEFEKLSLLMNKYLPDTVRYKLRERVRVVQRLFQAINSQPNEKSEKLMFLIKEEKNNLVTEDKIKILDAYINLSSTMFTRDIDKHYQLDLIKLIIEDNLSIEQKQKINKYLDFFIRYFKEAGSPELQNEVENLYNRIKVQAMKQLMS